MPEVVHIVLDEGRTANFFNICSSDIMGAGSGHCYIYGGTTGNGALDAIINKYQLKEIADSINKFLSQLDD